MKTKLLSIIVIFLLGNSVFAQSLCTLDILQQDTIICPSQPVLLSTSVSPDTINFRYTWSTAEGLSDSTAANPIASPTRSITYSLTISATDSTELVQNGDFQAGNVGFVSSYRDSSSIWNEGTYSIVTSPSSVHPGFSPCPDHTAGNGRMMAINGTGTPNTVVWSQTITVQPFIDYEFSAWVINILQNAASLPDLQFSINGNLIGNQFTPLATECQWSQFFTVWNSDTSSTALIEIINQSTRQVGNDFAIDDISFRAVCRDYDSVTINVHPEYPFPEYGIVTADTTICDNAPVDILVDYPSAVSYNWSDGSFSNPLQVNSGGNYNVIITDFCGRAFADSVSVSEGFSPVQTLPADTTVCAQTITVLNAYQPNATSYQWRGQDVYFNQNNSTDTVFTATYAGVYEVDVTNDCGTITQRVNLEHENCSCEPFVPNAFTPDGDGNNDNLLVYFPCEDITEYRFTIYNRWGELIYSSTDRNQGWDGLLYGDKAPSAVYVWKLEYIGPDSRGDLVSRVQHGDVTVIR